MTETTKKPARSTAAFSAEERDAMKEAKKERRRASAGKADGEADLKAKIAEMEGSDRELAQGLHDLISASAPGLTPKTWYGMPAWAREGKIVCFFQSAAKFKSRYATLGFSDTATLDDGDMWPVYYALTELNTGTRERIEGLLRQAATA